MTGMMPPNPLMSNFTLNLLKDTGWYNVDFQKSEVFLWGKGLGCNFFNDKCDPKNDQFYCDEVIYNSLKEGAMGCNYDHT